ncbi:MAG: disulfide bond formation protein DsbA [Betaproteobacteria bacterium]|nr:MAG: disulfide bond formation protein DsbA [Betaproteobacteria bacterium]
MKKRVQGKQDVQIKKEDIQLKKAIFIGSAVLLVLVFVIGIFLYERERLDKSAKAAEQNLTFLARGHSPRLGPVEAKVHIVEFFDPACGTCREFYPLVKDLMKANRDKIRLSLRYAPFHAGADNVVRILEAARKQDKYWQTLEAVLASQPYWAPNHKAEVERVWPQLGNLGLDMERIRRDMYAPEIDGVITQDLADAKALNVTMTPEFFVNGRPLPSFGYEQLKKLVDDAVAKAYP